METKVLSVKNAHRAAVVRQIAHPEYGDWRWEWRGEPLNKGFFGCTRWAHVAGTGSNSIAVEDDELHLWEVVSWKYEVNLEELWDIAVRAFHGTSFLNWLKLPKIHSREPKQKHRKGLLK